MAGPESRRGLAPGVLIGLGTLAFVVGGLARPPHRHVAEITVLDAVGPDAAIGGEGFRPGAVFPTTQAPVLGDLALMGSWLGSDASTGRTVSPSFQARRTFYVLIAGYPRLPGNSLTVEMEYDDGRTASLALADDDAGEQWTPVRVTLPRPIPAKVRIVAVDGATGARGWVGFSMPFAFVTGWRTATWGLIDLARILSTFAASVFLVFAPGLALRTRPSSRWAPAALLPVPGVALLVGTGWLAWALARGVPPRVTVTLVIVPVMVWCTVRIWRAGLSRLLSPTERRAAGMILAVAAIAVAKGVYSGGPSGELFAGTVSRTLEVGDRSDSRISYHVVQLVAHGTRPNSRAGKLLFAPWSFSHRGPFAGLAASPIVLLAGADVPTTMPGQPWQPFDPEGFAAYRILMTIMAAASLWVLFGVTTALLNPEAGLLALALACLTPFVVHELYFTWPKLPAAACVLLAFHALRTGRAAAGGLCCGVGFLFHPLALLSVPPLALLWIFLGLRDQRPAAGIARGLVGLAGTFAAVMLAWAAFNGRHYAQADFARFVIQADARVPGDLMQWLRVRAMSLANTLVPLHLYRVHGAHPSINSYWGPSPDVIRFFFQYWTTLPLACGILGFPLLVWALGKAMRDSPIAVGIAVVIPFLLFFVYWGGAATGMLREGLHAWVLTVPIVLVWSRLAAGNGGLGAWPSAMLALRGVEILLLLLLPAWLTHGGGLREPFEVTDAVALTVIVVATGILAREAYRVYRSPVPADGVRGRG